MIQEGTVLWEPAQEQKRTTRLYQYMEWLRSNKGLSFQNYDEVWEWSVTDTDSFWESIWKYFDVLSSGSWERVLSGDAMPEVHWFEGAHLNYAEQVFRHGKTSEPAILFQSEQISLTEMTWDTLRRQVASVAQTLKDFGVVAGDRVVSYMPNTPQSVVAFLACASIGAVWSSCSPDFGTSSVIDRFLQIEPKVLFAVDGYSYNGKGFDRTDVVRALQQKLTTVEHTIFVPYLNPNASNEGMKNTILWSEAATRDADLDFVQVPFEHPLWILYSSGTTGLPKAIVQSQGGILLEHMKVLALQCDVTEDDRFFWFTTTGWMMWNLLVGSLLLGTTIVLYDGSPAYPSLDVLWSLAEDTGMTHLGTSASFITSCMKAGIEPGKTHDLTVLKSVGSTGSPLAAEGFKWVYEHVKPDIWLAPVSGGTDICSGFVGPCPDYPVRAGEIQCRFLGSKVEAFDEDGKPLVDEVGELVITKPIPSMPLYFWNDPEKTRYKESYFDMYKGVWRHGDWIKIMPSGGCVIYGRSDSTINRHGVRMGTSDIYQAVEALEEIQDSLVVDLELLGRASFLPLFVVLKKGVQLNDDLQKRIAEQIRTHISPRHVPDAVYEVKEIPRTLNGKKMEVPIRKILLGHPMEKAVNIGSMSNPSSLDFFVALAKTL